MLGLSQNIYKLYVGSVSKHLYAVCWVCLKTSISWMVGLSKTSNDYKENKRTNQLRFDNICNRFFRCLPNKSQDFDTSVLETFSGATQQICQ